jgi:protocatechuate 3,4-dioxygenase beta subunit
MSDQKDSRRQFIKNISLTAAAFTLSPLAASARTSEHAQKAACDKTTLDYYGEGPFYTANPPIIAAGKLAKATEAGTKIRITGRVQNLDCSEFIENTVVDVWHANDAGAYDNQGFNLRGKVLTNAQGFYMIETIKPGKYLNGSKYRPSHIHFKITPPGFSTITTQLYFQGDSSIAEDAAASISSGTFDATNRIIALTENSEGVYEGTWDIAVDGKGTMGVGEMHLDKGIIYTASPNPFSSSLNINYGVFKKAAVSLLVFDIQGRIVATLNQRTLDPQKYDAVWTPDADLPNGHYFVALKINDIQVHYLKVQFVRE